ncbi:MAG: hypothetical protein WCC81_02855 [Pseudolabrys sp.]
MQSKAENGRKQARPKATNNACDKNRRHEEKVERLGAERRRDQRARNERNGDQRKH